jgi:ubiquinone/menaquinone biosynthesis C-methylase UbiE
MSTASAAVNFWPNDSTAKAFWSQHELPPYQQLLADTAGWLDPQPSDHWLDLGCGGGHLTRALCHKSGGQLAEVVALDCAAKNARAIEKLVGQLQPAFPVRFIHADFSEGLALFKDCYFHGVVSGLAIQYAESYSQELGRWTTEALEHLLQEVNRILQPGGSFVFSVNVPEPSWGKVALRGLPAVFRSSKPMRFLKNALRMYRFGFWISREARCGRFHYLPAEATKSHLERAGFGAIEHRLSYADQAFIFRCYKPNKPPK